MKLLLSEDQLRAMRGIRRCGGVVTLDNLNDYLHAQVPVSRAHRVRRRTIVSLAARHLIKYDERTGNIELLPGGWNLNLL